MLGRNGKGVRHAARLCHNLTAYTRGRCARARRETVDYQLREICIQHWPANGGFFLRGVDLSVLATHCLSGGLAPSDVRTLRLAFVGQIALLLSSDPATPHFQSDLRVHPDSVDRFRTRRAAPTSHRANGGSRKYGSFRVCRAMVSGTVGKLGLTHPRLSQPSCGLLSAKSKNNAGPLFSCLHSPSETGRELGATYATGPADPPSWHVLPTRSNGPW